MSYEEIADQYMDDFPNLLSKGKTFQVKFGSLVKRSRKYPVTAQYEYTSHIGKNRYLFCYTAYKRSDWENPYCNAICIFEGKGGKYAMTTTNFQKTVIIFTPHFFSRYRERILHGEEIYGETLMKRYFSRNTRFILKEINENFAKAYKRYEDDESQTYAAKVFEGNIFLKMYSDKVIICRTILSDEMLYDNQTEAFGELQDELKRLGHTKIQGYNDHNYK